MTAHRPDRVISFDLDGTLINGPFSRVLTDLGDELDRRHATAGAKREILRRHEQLLATDLLGAYDWHTIVDGYLGELDVAVPFGLLDRLDRYATDGSTRILHDDTIPLLGALRDAGWRVIILTNGWRRYQEPILRHSGLLAAVDLIITSDDVGRPKPAAVTFAAARNGARDHVHVGDRIDHDVVGGKESGARTVLLRTDAPTDPDDHVDYLLRRAKADGMPDPDLAAITPDLITNRLAGLVEWLRLPSAEPVPEG